MACRVASIRHCHSGTSPRRKAWVLIGNSRPLLLSRRASRCSLVSSQAFSKPLDIRAEAADLGIKLLHLRLVLALDRLDSPLVVGERAWKAFNCLRLPLVKLARMNPILRRDLGYALFLTEELEDNLRPDAGWARLLHGPIIVFSARSCSVDRYLPMRYAERVAYLFKLRRYN